MDTPVRPPSAVTFAHLSHECRPWRWHPRPCLTVPCRVGLRHGHDAVMQWACPAPKRGKPTVPRPALAYEAWRTWTAEHGLVWEGVGLDIEPEARIYERLMANPWGLAPLPVRRLLDAERPRRARAAYGALVERIRADGYAVENYQFSPHGGRTVGRIYALATGARAGRRANRPRGVAALHLVHAQARLRPAVELRAGGGSRCHGRGFGRCPIESRQA